MSFRPACREPLVSKRQSLAGSPPSARMSRAIVVLEAPAPSRTILASPSFLPASLSALIRPARVTQAVPWASSCHTGMSHASRSSSRTRKQLGCEMSSRLIAPKECWTIFTNSMILAGSFLPSLPRESTQRATASTPPRYFIRKALPSMTPRPPGGVQSPSPRTRVESETTPTRLPRLDRAKDRSLSSRMPVDTAETPGVYQTLNQLKPHRPHIGTVCILPPKNSCAERERRLRKMVCAFALCSGVKSAGKASARFLRLKSRLIYNFLSKAFSIASMRGSFLPARKRTMAPPPVQT